MNVIFQRSRSTFIFQNTNMAVMLAEVAVNKEETPHMLDTLAQSYFAAGKYKEAVEAGKKALSMTDADTPYYEKQLAKFSKYKNLCAI